MKKNFFVLDCSLTMTWCFPDEATAYTHNVLNSFVSKEAKVPSLWPYEVANILWVAERNQRISKAQTLHFKSLLELCPINVDNTSATYILNTVLDIARDQHLTVYDAAYLELAMREDLPLATLDKALQKAAHKVGISLFVPH